jgi:hypothetical protein
MVELSTTACRGKSAFDDCHVLPVLMLVADLKNNQFAVL